MTDHHDHDDHDEPSRCESCNVPYTDHMGIQGTCAKLQETEAKAERYRRALERCRMIIDDDAEWAYGRPVEKMKLVIAEALK